MTNLREGASVTLTTDRDQPRSSPAKEIARHTKSAFAVLLALVILVGGGWFVYHQGKDLLSGFGEIPDYPGPGKANITVRIPDGTSVAGMGEILVESDVIQSTKAWTTVTATEPAVTSIQAGSYRMKTQLPAREALAILLDSARSRIRSQVTVSEGLTLEQQVADLVKTTKIPKKNFDAALDKPASLGLPKYVGSNAEGVLYPQTYETTDQTTATSLIKQMTAEYASVTKSIDFEGRAKANKVSAYEALVIASIVEREVSRDEDRAKVARVLYNRLDQDMRLQLDSTVAYANKNFKTVTTTEEERDNPSPYNTYQHDGLPPGPISAPGRASLQAAVNPAAGDWLFFVTVDLDTGETKFATTAAAHQTNVEEFQAWCRANPGKGC
jgi:UPF0755 protein